MPRTLGPHPGRIGLAVAFAIAGAFVVSGLAARTRENTNPRPEPASAEVAAVPRASEASGHASTPAGESDVASAAIAAASVASVASARSAAPEPPAATAGADPHAAAGMIVGKDPVTGRIGKPTPEQRAEIERSAPLASPALDRSGEGLTVVHRPDGSKMVDLQGRFQEYTVVRIGPDGKKTQVCVQGPEVEAALAGSPAAVTEAPARAATSKAEER